ncbi:hypothetical protein [Corynebacterium maris]|uniref:hypothetical protein n=1 Tax=Corynebacterium maris TaxID=575200 RepID=UPI0012EB8FF6|nr:hypothetical protein [Corynebacterium maris]
MVAPPGMIQCQSSRLGGLPIHYAITERSTPDGLVVLMPAALSSKREDRKRIYFTRGKWVNEWPNAEVVSFSDPAVQQDERLNGAWYIHPEHDVVRTISEIVGEIATSGGIPYSRIVFYGSSLGGFGAIGAAAHLDGSRAVAEVPQIDFANWFAGSIKAVEKYIIGMPLEKYRFLHPEQISLLDRLELAGRIPEYKLISNPQDPCIDEQRAFFEWSHSSPVPCSGPVEMLLTTRVEGHRVLDRKDVCPHISP